EGAGPELGEEAREDTWIDTGGPGDGTDRNAIVAEARCQGAGRAGHHDLGDSQSTQLASQEPDLALPAAPLTTRRDVDHARGHASRATVARSARSSARLKGLWRYGRSRLSRKASVSPRTVSPVLKIRRAASAGWRRATSS